MSYAADATSRYKLQEFAKAIRGACRWNEPWFDIVKFMEIVMVQVFPEFNWEVVPNEELPGLEGLTLTKEHLIQLPERVYMDAVAGFGRARFSVAHEVAHYLLIDDNSVALCRSDVKLPAYRKPEWQANTLAAELLVPTDMTVGMGVDEIAWVFGVSFTAAKVHIKIKQEEGRP